jgi:hypothetical protein
MSDVKSPQACFWDDTRWKNFSVNEIACPCCGAVVVSGGALDKLQRLRDLMATPLRITSAVRCVRHNKKVGGARLSNHLLGIAFDIVTDGHDRRKLYWSAQIAGFTGFGFMEKALHVDTRKERAAWHYGPESAAAWAAILPPGTKQTGQI